MSMRESWYANQQLLYSGPDANTSADLLAYTGSAAVNRIVGKYRQEAFTLNDRQLRINYGKGRGIAAVKNTRDTLPADGKGPLQKGHTQPVP